jgi:hypothetical protein
MWLIPQVARLTWLAAFVHLRSRQLADNLVDLLIETIHHIGARAERRVERELLDGPKRVTGSSRQPIDEAKPAADVIRSQDDSTAVRLGSREGPRPDEWRELLRPSGGERDRDPSHRGAV